MRRPGTDRRGPVSYTHLDVYKRQAEIVTALEYMTLHPEFKHGKVAFSFTPDEEIGTSQDNFDVEAFGAQFAYTVDLSLIHIYSGSYPEWFPGASYIGERPGSVSYTHLDVYKRQPSRLR